MDTDGHRWIQMNVAERQPNCAKRLECVELAPAFEPPRYHDSASKLDALQTLRVEVRPQQPSQHANNYDYCISICVQLGLC
jgi:hypothetical protein